MSSKVWQGIGVLLCGLAVCAILSARPAARAADSYPFQGNQSFRTEGTVTMVDPDRDRVTITTPDGRQYNLDTDNTNIKLRDTDRPGNTGDLVVGMRVQINGRLLATDVVAADQVTVLPYRDGTLHAPASPTLQDERGSARPVSPVRPVGIEPVGAPRSNQSAIRLRGTVENVDDDNGLVVVRVRDHTRTIIVDHHTDLTDIASTDDAHIGLHPGDRVTVSGTLRGDGTVTADVISLSRDLAGAVAAPSTTDDFNTHQLVGRVSHQSNQYMSRDIKVRLESSRDVTVHVPHSARVLRNGYPISVHELSSDDVVRVIGSYDGDDFNATRIDVLQAYTDEQ